jgi:ssDNA-binding Zn-finger/Zn-ribbon topoisomerase 1
MVERVAKKGQNAGQKFLGCPNYPKCKEMAAIGG